MKRLLIWLIAFVAMTATAMAQDVSVNMNKYVTLTVRPGAEILLHFRATVDGTPVKLVSGSTEVLLFATTGWGEDRTFLADSTEMRIYGDLNGFESGNNGENITAIDVSTCPDLEMLGCFNNNLSTLDFSHNKKLKLFDCSRNNFSTEGINRIFCSLPDRTGEDEPGIIFLARNTSDVGDDKILSSSGE